MAIEKNDGDVIRWVSAYVKHLTSAYGGEFRSFTTPTVEDINAAIETGEAEILSWLAEAGYSTDTSAYSALALDYLSWYNSIAAAFRLELTHPGLQFQNYPNSRADKFYQYLMDLKKRILEEGISGIGVDQDGTGAKPTFTGRFHSEKEVDEQDPDTVSPFFARRQFSYPGTRDRVPPDPYFTTPS